jgi:hypothetical protein
MTDEDRHANEVSIAFQMGADWQRDRMKARIEKLEAALQGIADIEHEDLPKPVSAAEGTLWAILDGCVVVAKRALEGKDD